MLGDVLERRMGELSASSTGKSSPNAFWIILRNIAREEIIEYGRPIDSDVIIPLYYSILSRNQGILPAYFTETLPSNGQERFRVIIRNLFSSNAFHPDGLANQPGITARKAINETKKGERIVFRKAEEDTR